MKKLLLTFSFLFLAACAKDSGTQGDQAVVPNGQVEAPPTPPRPLDGRHQNCPDPLRRYKNRFQYCADLRNERWGRRCSFNDRYQAFRQHCPGQRWQR